MIIMMLGFGAKRPFFDRRTTTSGRHHRPQTSKQTHTSTAERTIDHESGKICTTRQYCVTGERAAKLLRDDDDFGPFLANAFLLLVAKCAPGESVWKKQDAGLSIRTPRNQRWLPCTGRRLADHLYLFLIVVSPPPQLSLSSSREPKTTMKKNKRDDDDKNNYAREQNYSKRRGIICCQQRTKRERPFEMMMIRLKNSVFISRSSFDHSVPVRPGSRWRSFDGPPR
jgi:hypothetical protein